jgi:hypothetical protein
MRLMCVAIELIGRVSRVESQVVTSLYDFTFIIILARQSQVPIDVVVWFVVRLLFTC